MLPDYPRLKGRLEQALRERMSRVEAERLGVLSGVQEMHIQEGRTSTLHREDGSSQEVECESIQVSQTLDVDFQSLEQLEVSEILRLYDKLAIALADAKAGHSFKVLNAELEKVGNVDSSERPLHEKILSSFERMEFDFVDGQPILPSIVANPDTRPLFEEALQHICETPELVRRYQEIIDDKRERFRDREADRKLVE